MTRRPPHPLTVLNEPERPSSEFAPGAATPPAGRSRRDFLKYAAVTAALAGGGIGGCTRQPREKIVPRVQVPEEYVPGTPVFFATTHTHDGYARGAIAESHDGRPTKLDGNPDHPATPGGGSDVWMQSAVWSLYDPDRLRQPTRLGSPSDWSRFSIWLRDRLPEVGDGLRILTGRCTSPTAGRLVGELKEKFPGTKWHRWQPVNDDAERAGLTAAFGRPLKPVYDLAKARVVVSLDADFLLGVPGGIAHARQWADARRAGPARLWVAESTPTITGEAADEVWRAAPAALEAFADFLVAHLDREPRRLAAPLAGRGTAPTRPASGAAKRFTDCAGDLSANAGACVVIAGISASPSIHAAAARLNVALGNVGQTVRYIEPVEQEPVDHAASLRELTADLNAGKVKLLVIADCDPVATAPADLDFAGALAKPQAAVAMSGYLDATAERCQWQLPLSFELEAWTDGRSHDGTAAVGQPLILPLHASRSFIELLGLMLDPTNPPDGQALVREFWEAVGLGEANWQSMLRKGLSARSASESVDATLQERGMAPHPPSTTRAATTEAAGDFDLLLRPDPCLWDGSYARNAWLAELPQPLTKLSWATALLISPADAEKLGLAFEGHGNDVVCPVVKVEVGGRSAEVPAFTLDGQPDGVATLHLGPAAYALRTADRPWHLRATLADTGRTRHLACTQRGFMQTEHDRTIVKVAPVGGSGGKLSDEGETPRETPNTLYPLWQYDGRIPRQNKWGMVIDTSACVGCNACVVACQSENNIPTVGEEQVSKGREMQWIRVDRYADSATGRGVFQPMMCQHCENAPCEVVCPVNATVHDIEGLNVQVYNRCIGTRYCSNNCPYKVRHFNFLHYQVPVGTQKLAMNPDVTVRWRGVMEKCTYCIQRISHARIESKKENRGVRDGEVVTACQQSCPTGAITFGNLNDPAAAVTKLQARPDSYGVLTELMTRPRTLYLPKYVNPANETAGAGGEA